MRLWVLLLGMCLAFGVRAEPVVNAEKLRTYGTNSANLIYVFTSAGCSHCAAYHEMIFPTLKSRFADTGLAQIKIVDMGFDVRSMAAAKLARCMTDSQYEIFMTDAYQNQSEWAYGGDYEKKLKGYANKAGLNKKSQERCLANRHLEDTILDQRNNLGQLYRITGTPTTVVVQGVRQKTFVGADPMIIPEVEKLLIK